METLEVVKDHGHWAIRLGARIVELFPTEARALDHANWLCQELAKVGSRANVVAPELAH